MKHYTVAKINGTPHWSKIPVLQIDTHNWLPPVDISAEGQICYDETGLYIHLRAKESHIRAEHKRPLSQVCEDSCLEFFFRPEETDPRYFNVEMNPNGCTYLGFGYGRSQFCRLAPAQEEAMMQKQINRLSDGWEVFYTIPVSFLQIFFPDYALTSGKKIFANCFKCGDLTPQEHYLSWNPSASPTPDFHRPEDFGEMILE